MERRWRSGKPSLDKAGQYRYLSNWKPSGSSSLFTTRSPKSCGSCHRVVLLGWQSRRGSWVAVPAFSQISVSVDSKKSAVFTFSLRSLLCVKVSRRGGTNPVENFVALSCFCLSIEPFPEFFLVCHIHLSELAEGCENSPLAIHLKCGDCPAKWRREDAHFLSSKLLCQQPFIPHDKTSQETS